MRRPKPNPFLFAMALTVACVQYNRTVVPDTTPEQVFAQLDGFTGFSSKSNITIRSNSSDDVATAFSNLAHSEGATLYYAHAPTPKKSVSNVVAIRDFTALGFDKLTAADIADVVVFFVDNPSHQPRNGLMVAIKKNNVSSYDVRSFVALSDANVQKFNFKATVSDGKSSLVLQSIETDNTGNLHGAVQLRVFKADGTDLGKFPSLLGFAQ